ncbi:hypothetical protein CMUS01_06692 [Colletotrichum musicola]|uniref:Uncharacterized protein n=1 Tax=Colletotrichum musicola TaxID=2175873 RepID=A0A8H6KL29_9PEZI|nr:hypothetical protein CMUS01_06692 [Colletotrichum musicola]
MLTPAAHRGPVLLTGGRGVLGLIPMEPIGSSMPDPALQEVHECRARRWWRGLRRPWPKLDLKVMSRTSAGAEEQGIVVRIAWAGMNQETCSMGRGSAQASRAAAVVRRARPRPGLAKWRTIVQPSADINPCALGRQGKGSGGHEMGEKRHKVATSGLDDESVEQDLTGGDMTGGDMTGNGRPRSGWLAGKAGITVVTFPAYLQLRRGGQEIPNGNPEVSLRCAGCGRHRKKETSININLLPLGIINIVKFSPRETEHYLGNME